EHVPDPVCRTRLGDGSPTRRRPGPPTADGPSPQAQAAAFEETNASELAHVPIAQLASIREAEYDPRVTVVRRSRRGDDERTGHTQGNGHQPTIGELQQHALRSPSYPRDDRPLQLSDEPLGRLRMANSATPAHLDISDFSPGDPAFQVARDGLDLRELRHTVSVAYRPTLDRDGGIG